VSEWSDLLARKRLFDDTDKHWTKCDKVHSSCTESHTSVRNERLMLIFVSGNTRKTQQCDQSG